MTDGVEQLLEALQPQQAADLPKGMRACHPSEARTIFGCPPLGKNRKPVCKPPKGFGIFTDDAAGCDAWSIAALKVEAEQERMRIAAHGADTAEPATKGTTLVRGS